MSRRNGAAGERELFALLSDELGSVVRRGLWACRDGGADTLDVPGWAIECKRTERHEAAHWLQAEEQAEREGRRPVLFWRASRRPWVAMVDLADVAPGVYPRRGETAWISLPAWCQLVREAPAPA
jgi:Holliday junction resolvase